MLVSGQPYIRDMVEQIVAAIGGVLHVESEPAAISAAWQQAEIVLVGSDIREVPPRRAAPAVLLGVETDGQALWQTAASLGAERVAVLPDAGPWLAEYLSRSQAPEPGGTVLGVTGGCGGAGATTSAIWLAQVAARYDIRTLLVDGDPWGGGIELSLAAEDVPGLRWPDFTEAHGSLDPGQLADSLPVCGGFSFLSWPGSRERPARYDGAISSVLEAARRGFELVIVDIGRGRDTVAAHAWECDRILLVTPPQLRAAVAAARLIGELPPVDVDLVVRGGPASSLDGELIAEAVGLPLSGVVPDIKATPMAVEQGRLLEIGQRRNVRRFALEVLGLADGRNGNRNHA
ncbi:CpaE-like family protein [Arthrobacter sp. M4]|nr:CpaE-like family protein [Arthrobacter sp. M4]